MKDGMTEWGKHGKWNIFTEPIKMWAINRLGMPLWDEKIQMLVNVDPFLISAH